MLTGESRPVHKHPGDEVIGGTVNGSGALRVRVTRTGEQTLRAALGLVIDGAERRLENGKRRPRQTKRGSRRTEGV